MSKPEHQFDVEITFGMTEGVGEWHARIEGVGRVVGYSLADAKEEARKFIAASQEIDYSLLDLRFMVPLQDRLHDTAARVLRNRGYDKYSDDYELWEEMLIELGAALAKEVETK
jgi:hypothetical protein